MKRGDDNGFDVKTMSRVKLGDDGELCDVSVRGNKEFQTEFLNLSYSSLTTPNKVLDMNMNDFSNIHVIKQTPVLNFDSDTIYIETILCRCTRQNKDSDVVGVSKDVWDMKSESKSPKPVHLYGYGSYGICIDPYFRRDILPLLDRGMILQSHTFEVVVRTEDTGTKWRASTVQNVTHFPISSHVLSILWRVRLHPRKSCHVRVAVRVVF